MKKHTLTKIKNAIKTLRKLKPGTQSHCGPSDFNTRRLEFVEIDLHSPPSWRVLFGDECTTIGRSVSEVTRQKRFLDAERVISSIRF